MGYIHVYIAKKNAEAANAISHPGAFTTHHQYGDLVLGMIVPEEVEAFVGALTRARIPVMQVTEQVTLPPVPVGKKLPVGNFALAGGKVTLYPAGNGRKYIALAASLEDLKSGLKDAGIGSVLHQYSAEALADLYEEDVAPADFSNGLEDGDEDDQLESDDDGSDLPNPRGDLPLPKLNDGRL